MSDWTHIFAKDKMENRVEIQQSIVCTNWCADCLLHDKKKECAIVVAAGYSLCQKHYDARHEDDKVILDVDERKGVEKDAECKDCGDKHD